MANICCNRHAFYTQSENKDELLRLHKNLSAVMEAPSEAKNAYDQGWLGLVAIKHGLDWEKEISCRGMIEHLDDYEPGNNFFTLESVTDWVPMDELWEAVIAQYKGVSFVYTAEECGERIYINTDIEGLYFPEKYLLEICGDAAIPKGWYANQEKPNCLEIREYFSSFDDLRDYCIKLMGKEFDTLEELEGYLSDLFDKESNTFANIHEFTTD